MPHPYLLKKQPSGAKVSQYNRKTGKIEAPEEPAPAPPGGDAEKSGDAALNLLSAASALASLEGPPPLPGQEVKVANPPAAPPAAAPASQQAAGIDTSGDRSPRGKSKTERPNKRFPDLVSPCLAQLFIQNRNFSTSIETPRKSLVDLLDICLRICSSIPL